MSALTLESLGLSKEELADRVVQAAADRLLLDVSVDDEGEPHPINSTFERQIEKLIKARTETTIAALAEKHVLPNVTTYVENLCLQETNRWGEKTGAKVTFIEYLVQRADAYLREEVDYDGKSQAEDRYNWPKNGTRIAYLVEKHLYQSIEVAMKQALKSANESIVGGIEKTVKMKLAEVAQQMTVSLVVKK
jgi:hypothetical protein